MPVVSEEFFCELVGEAYFKLSDFDKAEFWYREALSIKPDHIPAHLTLAKLLHRQVHRLLMVYIVQFLVVLMLYIQFDIVKIVKILFNSSEIGILFKHKWMILLGRMRFEYQLLQN